MSAGPVHGGAFRPMPCLGAGAAMLAVPTVLRLLAPAPTSAEDARSGVVVAVVLLIGALGVGLCTARPRGGAMPALALLCAGLGLVLAPPEPIWDGVCGIAALLFLIMARLNGRPDGSAMPLAEWLGRHRSMLAGAAITTVAAVLAADTPDDWSLLVAALVGLASTAISLALVRPRP